MSNEFGNIAIVGGTGFDRLPDDFFAEEVTVETPFGVGAALSVSYNYVEPHKLYFIARHGAAHQMAPHEIDYRRLIATARALDVRWIFATNAVGSLKPEIGVGSLVVLNDFIDFTRQRPLTMSRPGDPVLHTDVSDPYSRTLREILLTTAAHMQVNVRDGGTYLRVEGPRFETPAEIRMFAAWGADVVGMTGLPEAVLAREAGIEYAALAVVTNLAAGLSPNRVDHEANTLAMAESMNTVRDLLFNAAARLVEERA